MSSHLSDSFPQWQHRIKLLLESAWKGTDINETKIDRWLENFKGDVHAVDNERRLAFHLFQQFIYFGKTEVDESMRVLFRDHFSYPAIQELAATHKTEKEISDALSLRITEQTRFVGAGFPAESGPGLVYRFRLANALPTGIFPELNMIFVPQQGGGFALNPPSLRHIIFLDDFCATGQQIQQRLSQTIPQFRHAFPALRISFFLLFATSNGLDNVRKLNLFDDVAAAIVLEDDYRAFSPSSLYYKDAPTGVTMNDGLTLCTHYGTKLKPQEPLGYDNCQLLVGFEHNTPDNTLPVFSRNDPNLPWRAIFPRIEKQ